MTIIVFILILASGILSDVISEETPERLSPNVGKLLNEKFNRIKEEIDSIKFMLGDCLPCRVAHGTKDYCDCRNLEPKKDCLAFYQAGIKEDGLYRIFGPNFSPRYVFCDQTTQGGGWTVIQRRKYGNENFYRNWEDYKRGFGDLNSEFWLGNDNINDLTGRDNSTLLINMKITSNPKPVWAKYSRFSVGDESTKYTIHVNGFTGNTTDYLAYHNNQKFTTYDQDNDASSGNCAVSYKGAWWYKGCHYSNLNGLYVTETGCERMNWSRSCNAHATFSELKVRRNV